MLPQIDPSGSLSTAVQQVHRSGCSTEQRFAFASCSLGYPLTKTCRGLTRRYAVQRVFVTRDVPGVGIVLLPTTGVSLAVLAMYSVQALREQDVPSATKHPCECEKTVRRCAAIAATSRRCVA